MLKIWCWILNNRIQHFGTIYKYTQIHIWSESGMYGYGIFKGNRFYQKGLFDINIFQKKGKSLRLHSTKKGLKSTASLIMYSMK